MRKRSRSEMGWRYFFYFVATILCVTNIVFFICNWKDLVLDVSKESLMLTFIGFLFAFAGINIYSIFNTNIEAEKERLHELAEKYDGELKLSSQMLQFPEMTVMTYQQTLYLTTSVSLLITSFDTIQEIETRLTIQRDFIQSLKDNYKKKQFEKYKEDFTSLAKGVLVLLKQHKEAIKFNGFFRNQQSEESNYNEKLEQLITFVDELSYFEFEHSEVLDDVEPTTWKGKIKSVYDFAKKTFFVQK